MGREERVNVRLDQATARRLDQEAERRGQTRAEYTRAAIASQLRQDEEIGKRR